MKKYLLTFLLILASLTGENVKTLSEEAESFFLLQSVGQNPEFTIDGTDIKALVAINQGIELIIRDRHDHYAANAIHFHFPHLSSLVKNRFFYVNDRKGFGITLHALIPNRKALSSIQAVDGEYEVSELIYDFRHDKIIKLLINYSFKDAQGTVYSGTVQYKSPKA